MDSNEVSQPLDSLSANDRPLVSEFADDPEMADLVDLFVDELGDRIESLEQAMAASDLEQLRKLSHQLKGAAGGYGFMPITDLAGEVEKLVKNGQEISTVAKSLQDLVSLCKRAARSSD